MYSTNCFEFKLLNTRVKNQLQDFFSNYRYGVSFRSRRSNKAAPGLVDIDGEIYLDAYVRIKFDYSDKPVMLAIKSKYRGDTSSDIDVYQKLKNIVISCIDSLESCRLSTFEYINQKRYTISISRLDESIDVQIGPRRFQGYSICSINRMIELDSALKKLIESIEKDPLHSTNMCLKHRIEFSNS